MGNKKILDFTFVSTTHPSGYGSLALIYIFIYLRDANVFEIHSLILEAQGKGPNGNQMT